MNIPEEIRATLATPGAGLILKALRDYHKSQWRKLRHCTPEELREIQAVMGAIESLPAIIEALGNKHLDKKKDKDESLWLQFLKWCAKYRFDGR